MTYVLSQLMVLFEDIKKMPALKKIVSLWLQKINIYNYEYFV